MYWLFNLNSFCIKQFCVAVIIVAIKMTPTVIVQDIYLYLNCFAVWSDKKISPVKSLQVFVCVSDCSFMDSHNPLINTHTHLILMIGVSKAPHLHDLMLRSHVWHLTRTAAKERPSLKNDPDEKEVRGKTHFGSGKTADRNHTWHEGKKTVLLPGL